MFELPNAPDDTSPEARELMIELIRNLTPTQKLGRIFDLSAFAKSLIVAEIKRDNKNISERDLKMEIARRMYGIEEGSRIADLYK